MEVIDGSVKCGTAVCRKARTVVWGGGKTKVGQKTFVSRPTDFEVVPPGIGWMSHHETK